LTPAAISPIFPLDQVRQPTSLVAQDNVTCPHRPNSRTAWQQRLVDAHAADSQSPTSSKSSHPAAGFPRRKLGNQQPHGPPQKEPATMARTRRPLGRFERLESRFAFAVASDLAARDLSQQGNSVINADPNEPVDLRDVVLQGNVDRDIADEVIRHIDNHWYVSNPTVTPSTYVSWGFWSGSAPWKNIRLADLNADSRLDILGQTGGEWWAAISEGNAFTNVKMGTWSPTALWDKILIGDFNGDARDDVAGLHESGDWWVSTSTGSSFDTQKWGRWSGDLNWNDVMTGDFDGDGKDDVVGRTSGQWWVGHSDGVSFVNEKWGQWSTDVEWSRVQVADVNGDGLHDILGLTGDQWWGAVSDGKRFLNESFGVTPPVDVK
jgi:hypothetical protein